MGEPKPKEKAEPDSDLDPDELKRFEDAARRLVQPKPGEKQGEPDETPPDKDS